VTDYVIWQVHLLHLPPLAGLPSSSLDCHSFDSPIALIFTPIRTLLFFWLNRVNDTQVHLHHQGSFQKFNSLNSAVAGVTSYNPYWQPCMWFTWFFWLGLHVAPFFHGHLADVSGFTWLMLFTCTLLVRLVYVVHFSDSPGSPLGYM